MFINLENGNLKLYDLRIYKKMDDIKFKLIYESPKTHYDVENTSISAYEGKIINNGDMIKNIWCERTGKVRSYNDFYSEDEVIYLYHYDLYHLNNLYLILDKLQNDDYTQLEKIGGYIKGDIQDDMFLKYQSKIMKSFKLLEISSNKIGETEKIYYDLLNNCNGDMKKKLTNIKEYLGIYSMDLEGIPKQKKMKN